MISPFEYVTVLISIILGMGITKLISGLAAIIQRWHNVKIYWPHMLLIILVFVIHIQDWWATYELASYKYWRLPTFLFIILYPVILYILTTILFPIRWGPGKPIDLKEFYFCNYRKIYLFMMLLPAHSFIDNHFIGGYAIEDQLLQIALFLMLLLIVLLNRRDEWIHKTTAILFSTALVITFIVEWNTLLIVGK
ncbi:MAG: hypothetical protein ACKVOQ_14405 [Cyclobacteriaceae bacterium]